jgi:hypothetical protein
MTLLEAEAPSERTLSPESAAYHEAGHAVMAFHLKRAVNRLSIVREGNLGGYVRYPHPRALRRRTFVVQRDGSLVANPNINAPRRRSRTTMERHLKVTLAGSAAQAVYENPSIRKQLTRGDYVSAVGIAMGLWCKQYPEDGSGDVSMALELARELLGCEAKEEVDTHLAKTMGSVLVEIAFPPLWSAVEAVATALLARQELSGRTARQIYLSARGLARIRDGLPHP